MTRERGPKARTEIFERVEVLADRGEGLEKYLDRPPASVLLKTQDPRQKFHSVRRARLNGGSR